jgi:hypothetical protein
MLISLRAWDRISGPIILDEEEKEEEVRRRKLQNKAVKIVEFWTTKAVGATDPVARHAKRISIK